MMEERTQSELAACARIQTLPANTVLWDDERQAEFVGVLLSGYMRYQRYGIDGRRQILCLMHPGDIVGDPQDIADGYSLETATEATICRFDRRSFERLVQSRPDLARSVYRQRSVRLDKLRWLTWSLGALSAEERLCAFLVQATTHMPFVPEGNGGTLTMLVPRRDIADLLATTVESISRTTQKLAAAGILDIRSPVRFRIPDLQRLASLGCDPAGVVQRPGRLLTDRTGASPRQGQPADLSQAPLRRVAGHVDSRQCAERVLPTS